MSILATIEPKNCSRDLSVLTEEIHCSLTINDRLRLATRVCDEISSPSLTWLQGDGVVTFNDAMREAERDDDDKLVRIYGTAIENSALLTPVIINRADYHTSPIIPREIVQVPECIHEQLGAPEYAAYASGPIVVSKETVDIINEMLTQTLEPIHCDPTISELDDISFLLASQFGKKRSANEFHDLTGKLRGYAMVTAALLELSTHSMYRLFRNWPGSLSDDDRMLSVFLSDAAFDLLKKHKDAHPRDTGILTAIILERVCNHYRCNSMMKAAFVSELRLDGTTLKSTAWTISASDIDSCEQGEHRLSSYWPHLPMRTATLQYANGYGASVCNFLSLGNMDSRVYFDKTLNALRQQSDALLEKTCFACTLPLSSGFPNLRAFLNSPGADSRLCVDDLNSSETSLLIRAIARDNLNPFLHPDMDGTAEELRPRGLFTSFSRDITWLMNILEGTTILIDLEFDPCFFNWDHFEELLPNLHTLKPNGEICEQKNGWRIPLCVGVYDVSYDNRVPPHRFLKWMLTQLEPETNVLFFDAGEHVELVDYLVRWQVESWLGRMDNIESNI